MKTKNREVPADYSGSLDGMIYYRDRMSGKLYARKQFTFKDHPGQAPFASAQKAIYALNPSRGFKQNLTDYMIGYNALKESQGREVMSWANLYNKMMFAMQKKLGIALKDINREMISSQNLPCSSVKAAVEAGLLPVVKDYERFNKPI